MLALALGGEVTAVDSAVGLRLGERWRVGGVPPAAECASATAERASVM